MRVQLTLEESRGESQIEPPRFFGFNFLLLDQFLKAFVTVLCSLTCLLTLIRWHLNWLCHHNKSRNQLCVDCEISTFRSKLAKYRQLYNGFKLFCRFQLLNAVFLPFWNIIIQISIKSENLKIQDGGHLWRHLCEFGCHGKQLDTTCFYLIEGTKKAYYMY